MHWQRNANLLPALEAAFCSRKQKVLNSGFSSFWGPSRPLALVQVTGLELGGSLMVKESPYELHSKVGSQRSRAHPRSMGSRLFRAFLLSTTLYSSLFFCYLMARVIINQAPLNSPFIDNLLPWLTFLRLATLALVLGFLCLVAYLALYWRTGYRSEAQNPD